MNWGLAVKVFFFVFYILTMLNSARETLNFRQLRRKMDQEIKETYAEHGRNYTTQKRKDFSLHFAGFVIFLTVCMTVFAVKEGFFQ